MMTDTRTYSMLDRHLPLSHEHSRPSSAASASTSSSNNSSPFSSPQSPVSSSSSSLPSSSSAAAHSTSAATLDDFLRHLHHPPPITSSLNHPPSSARRAKADPSQSPLTPPFASELFGQSSSFHIAPTVTSSLSSSPRHPSSVPSTHRSQAGLPPLVANHRATTQRDFVHSAHLPLHQQQQQQQQPYAQYHSSHAGSLLNTAGLDDDDDLSAAWNGHSALSFDSVDDYDETDFQLAAQQLRADNAAKQLMADMVSSRAGPLSVRSVSVNSSASSTILAPPGFHYHNHSLGHSQSRQQHDAAAELAAQLDSLALHREKDREWESSTRSQSLPQQQQNHYQLYSSLPHTQPLHSSSSSSSSSHSHSHKLQHQHGGHSPSFASSSAAPLYSHSHSHLHPVSGPANGCNLYVDQLPIPFGEHDLRTIFSPFGHIEKLRVAIDPLTGEQMGYGFVLFSNSDDAHRAIVALHGCALGGKTMHVSVAKQRTNPKRSSQPNTPLYGASHSGHANSLAAHLSLAGCSPSHSHSPPAANTNVYLAGIPHSWVKADLDELTCEFGRICESRVLVDKQTQENRGIGFVRFERVEEAAAAILTLNGTVPPGGNEVMTVKLAVERGEGRRDSLRNDSRAMTALQALKAQRSLSGSADALSGSKGLDAALQRFCHSDDGVEPRHLSLTRRLSGQLSSTSSSQHTSALAPPPILRSSSEDSPACAGKSAGGVDLFVFHLPVSCTEGELVQLFSIYGSVLSCAVMRDRRTGEHKGFGFVTMERLQEAEAAVKYLTGYALGSKYLKVSFKTNKQQHSHSPNY